MCMSYTGQFSGLLEGFAWIDYGYCAIVWYKRVEEGIMGTRRDEDKVC